MPVNAGNRKKYEIEASPFYKLASKPKLAKLLRLRRTSVIARIGGDSDYRIRPQPSRPEKILTIPNFRLKNLQIRIKELLSRISTPEYLYSGVKRRSYIDNANAHKNGKYVLALDISKFYESCDIEFVFRFWRYRLKMPEDLEWRMAVISTYSKYIPRGSSHSQLIAYWSYKDMFDEIRKMARFRGYIFTVYVDDMAFSSPLPIPGNFINEVNSLLKKYRLQINHKKTKYFSEKNPKLITGIIIHHGDLRAPNKRTKEIIDLVGELNKSVNVDQAMVNSVCGKINSIRQIEKGRFVEIYAQMRNLKKN